MKEKQTSRKNSKTAGLNSKSNRRVLPMTKDKDMVYFGNDCITRYWVYNDEHDCIAYGKIESEYDDLVRSLQQQKEEVAIG